jgi:hypothetical protein
MAHRANVSAFVKRGELVRMVRSNSPQNRSTAGDRSRHRARHERIGQVVDAASDHVADCADPVLDRLPGGVDPLPIDAALARMKRALIAAAQRDDMSALWSGWA